MPTGLQGSVFSFGLLCHVVHERRGSDIRVRHRRGQCAPLSNRGVRGEACARFPTCPILRAKENGRSSKGCPNERITPGTKPVCAPPNLSDITRFSPSSPFSSRFCKDFAGVNFLLVVYTANKSTDRMRW